MRKKKRRCVRIEALERRDLLAGVMFSEIMHDGPPLNAEVGFGLPLIEEQDLEYIGAFRVPNGTFGDSKFAAGGMAPAYNPANDSMFIVGHPRQQAIAEISIPDIIASDQIDDLATAQVLQPLEIIRDRVNMFGQPPIEGDSSSSRIGGLLVVDDQLIGSVYEFYDANLDAEKSHFRLNASDLESSPIEGLFEVGDLGDGSGGLVGGYMTHVPEQWQDALGAQYLTGQGPVAIRARTSSGPAAFGFNPDDFGSTVAPVDEFVYYPQSEPVGGFGLREQNPIYNNLSSIDGVVFVPETRSVLYFGSHGTGPVCYGHAEECDDSVRVNKGYHSEGGEYTYQVWAYDALDFVAVRNGELQPWEVQPYDVWAFDFPFEEPTKYIGGVAYDPATGRIFVTQKYADVVGFSNNPIVHVFQSRTHQSSEFIEIDNSSSVSIDLTGWQIRGAVEFDFGAGVTIPAESALVVTPFDPLDPDNNAQLSSFIDFYEIEDTQRIVGGYGEFLKDHDGELSLLHPAPSGSLLEDRAWYDDSPRQAGSSLSRVLGRAGLDPENWFSTPPTPGLRLLDQAGWERTAAAQTITQDSSLLFSASNGNAFVIEDAEVDDVHLQMTIDAIGGTVTLGDTEGLRFVAGNGVRDRTISAIGLVSDLNRSLEGIVFRPTTGFTGLASLAITTATGSPFADSRTVPITVLAADDTLPPPPQPPSPLGGLINFNNYTIGTYGGAGNDSTGSVTIEDDGSTLHLVGNRWKRIVFPYTLTEETILEFDFRSPLQGEIHGIGFDNDLYNSQLFTFQLYGTEEWGRQEFDDYANTSTPTKHYRIPIGQFVRGAKDNLFFVNDHDVDNPNAESFFSNVKVYEANQSAPPNANDDTYTVTQGEGPATLEVLANDTAALDDEILSIINVGSGSAGGSAEINSGGTSIEYSPAADFIGTETFSYTINSGTPGNDATGQVSVSVSGPVGAAVINFSDYTIGAYGAGNDKTGPVTIEDDGLTLHLVGNRWKRIDFPYTITEETILEFDFRSPVQGEIHGIGFDNDLYFSEPLTFQIYGTEDWGRQEFADYDDTLTSTKHYRIPIGRFDRGTKGYLFFINDHDVDNPNAESFFSNVNVHEADQNQGNPPVAHDDIYTMTQDAGPEILKVLANDTAAVDGEDLAVIDIGPTSAGGVANISSSGASIEYTPAADFIGTETFSYTINSGTPGNDATGRVSVSVSGPAGAAVINFSDYTIGAYGAGNDKTGPVTIEDDGLTLHLVGNRWKRIDFPYTITEETILEFDFRSPVQGEIHGIGFDNDLYFSEPFTFEIYGTEDWGRQEFHTYNATTAATQHYFIPIGQFTIGTKSHLFFINDHDVSNPTAESFFSNLKIYEASALDLPDANDDAFAVTQGGGSHLLDVLSNDTSASGTGSLTITDVGLGSDGGEILITADGSGVRYTPAVSFIGTETFTYAITDDTGYGSASVSVSVSGVPGIDFGDYEIGSYGGANNDDTGPVTIEDDGRTLHLVGNRWKRIDFPYTITRDTVLEFDFSSSVKGDIHGIGFDNDLFYSEPLTFQVYGTETWGRQDFRDYDDTASTSKHYVIPIGQFTQGAKDYLFFINDHDTDDPTADSRFSNVRVYESNTANDNGDTKGGDSDPIEDQIPNAPPTANHDAFRVLRHTGPRELDVLANDSSAPDVGELLKITSLGAPSAGGLISVTSGGASIQYTPAAGFVGTETFSYTINDGTPGNDDTAMVSVVISDPFAQFRKTAPSLPDATGTIIRVSTEAELQDAITNLQSNVTVLIEPGTYILSHTLHIRDVENVVIRGATDNREDVVLIGRGMYNLDYSNLFDGISLENARQVTIANLSIHDVWGRAIHLDAESDAPHFRNLHLMDVGGPFILGSSMLENGVSAGIVEYSLLEYSTTARSDETGGIEVNGGDSWIIRDNEFRNIRSPDGFPLAGPAVLFHNGSIRTVTVGNLFLNVQIAIAYGSSSETGDGHSGSFISDNFIHRTVRQDGGVGIYLANSAFVQVIGNTVILNGTYGNSIEYWYPGTLGSVISNNVTDMPIESREGGLAFLGSNTTDALDVWFSDDV